MKKLFFLIVGCSCAVLLNAQNNAANSTIKKMTVEEANRLNGSVEPTINGKPYSQYKAEQDALKRQPAAPKPAVPAQFQVQQQSWTGRTVEAVTPKTTQDARTTPDISMPEQKKAEALIVSTNTTKTVQAPVLNDMIEKAEKAVTGNGTGPLVEKVVQPSVPNDGSSVSGTMPKPEVKAPAANEISKESLPKQPEAKPVEAKTTKAQPGQTN
jgi:hypothetical protein